MWSLLVTGEGRGRDYSRNGAAESTARIPSCKLIRSMKNIRLSNMHDLPIFPLRRFH
jgi:hypothetical protein